MRILLDANICLDLLDTTRATSAASVEWYMKHKDNEMIEFYLSGDFITSFYYILAERRKLPSQIVVQAIDALTQEISPLYLSHSDFIFAKSSFFDGEFDDFDDLLILHSAIRGNCEQLLTNNKSLLRLSSFKDLNISDTSA
ncbi:MAG TPA: hypothetical protein EYG98_04235 [Sulfurovum sp.]|nr:hypothetical protein [Sulfurovum sp.]